MLSRPFICGTFHPEEDDELGAITSPSSTPRRSSFKKHSFCRTHNGSSNKNPYSTRGLDKFEKLLADLEEKKKQIYTQNDPDDISLVRFAYTSSNDCVPIVVKSKDNKNNGQSRSPPRETSDQDYKKPTHDVNPNPNPNLESVQHDHNQPNDKAKPRSSWKLSWEQLRRPAYYMPAAIILILVLLMFFGRSVAILCTSIGWYMVPTLKGGSSVYVGTKPGKKKVLGRRSSENRITVNRDRSPEKSHEQHGHRKSW